MGGEWINVSKRAENQRAALDELWDEYPGAFDIAPLDGIWCAISNSWILQFALLVVVIVMLYYGYSLLNNDSDVAASSMLNSAQ